MMPSTSSDIWLLLDLGEYLHRQSKVRLIGIVILGYFGSLAVHKQLVAIRQASEVITNDKRPNISRQTEDGKMPPLCGKEFVLRTTSAEA